MIWNDWHIAQGKHLGSGGQGTARKAELTTGRVEMVLKTLPLRGDDLDRLRHLTDLKLPQLSPYLAGPVALKYKPRKRGISTVEHLAPFADGKTLDEDDPRTFPQLLEMAHHLACQLTILEENGLAHGDLAPSNIMINPDGVVHLIDFDNFAADDPGVLVAPMMGQRLMAVPEVFQGKARPGITSDRYATAVLFHLILLLRHPADCGQGHQGLRARMDQGGWLERHYTPQPDETPICLRGHHTQSFRRGLFAGTGRSPVR